MEAQLRRREKRGLLQGLMGPLDEAARGLGDLLTPTVSTVSTCDPTPRKRPRVTSHDVVQILPVVHTALTELKAVLPREYRLLSENPSILERAKKQAMNFVEEYGKQVRQLEGRISSRTSTGDIASLLSTILPRSQIDMIKEAANFPTYDLNITTPRGSRWLLVTVRRDGDDFFPPIKLRTLIDVDLAKLWQVISIIIEIIFLCFRIFGIVVCIRDMRRVVTELEPIVQQSVVQRAYRALVEAWNASAATAFARAKAIVAFLISINAPGILVKICGVIINDMSWKDRITTLVVIVAMFAEVLGTGGTVLVAKIVLALVEAYKLKKKFDNMKKLAKIKQDLGKLFQEKVKVE